MKRVFQAKTPTAHHHKRKSFQTKTQKNLDRLCPCVLSSQANKDRSDKMQTNQTIILISISIIILDNAALRYAE